MWVVWRGAVWDGEGWGGAGWREYVVEWLRGGVGVGWSGVGVGWSEVWVWVRVWRGCGAGVGTC